MDTHAAPANNAATGLRHALDTALACGITADEIQDMVAQRIIPDHSVASPADIIQALDDADPVTPNSGASEVIYRPDEVPPGLIDLPSAARKYGIKVHTLRMWTYLGKLPNRGRVLARAPGGGYILTDEAAIPYCRDNPRKRGRKKTITT